MLCGYTANVPRATAANSVHTPNILAKRGVAEGERGRRKWVGGGNMRRGLIWGRAGNTMLPTTDLHEVARCISSSAGIVHPESTALR